MRGWAVIGVAAAALAAPAAAAAIPYDFDGDHRQELAAGIPDAVVAVHSARHGLTRKAQVLRGLDGSQLASGDFDRNGRADLAALDGDEVRVTYGSSRGLDPSRTTTWSEPEADIASVAAADVDGD